MTKADNANCELQPQPPHRCVADVSRQRMYAVKWASDCPGMSRYIPHESDQAVDAARLSFKKHDKLLTTYQAQLKLDQAHLNSKVDETQYLRLHQHHQHEEKLRQPQQRSHISQALDQHQRQFQHNQQLGAKASKNDKAQQYLHRRCRQQQETLHKKAGALKQHATSYRNILNDQTRSTKKSTRLMQVPPNKTFAEDEVSEPFGEAATAVSAFRRPMDQEPFFHRANREPADDGANTSGGAFIGNLTAFFERRRESSDVYINGNRAFQPNPAASGLMLMGALQERGSTKETPGRVATRKTRAVPRKSFRKDESRAKSSGKASAGGADDGDVMGRRYTAPHVVWPSDRHKRRQERLVAQVVHWLPPPLPMPDSKSSCCPCSTFARPIEPAG